MDALSPLFENNRVWADQMLRSDPEFFSRLSQQQRPTYLWIGCSDSRVPANQIVGLLPGELFVHRNVANMVVQTDLNCLSVLQFAVEVLQIRHVIVCGHYGCSGVVNTLRGSRLGLIDNWLQGVRRVLEQNREQIDALPTEALRQDRLCELNVLQQVVNVSRTTILQDAWGRSQEVSVHGWIYGVEDGLLRDLGMCIRGGEDLAEQYDIARRRPSPRAAR